MVRVEPLNLTTGILTTILALAALGAANVIAGESAEAIDTTERKLETGRHEQLLSRISEADATMNSFTTDGCSGGLSLAWEQLSDRFPEFARTHGSRPPWEECCVVHDREYHAGGAAALSATESFDQRKDADLQLKACVTQVGIERSGALENIYGLSDKQIEDLYQTIADLMYRAIRLGGIPCTNQTWRWGYGWPKCR
jgi:hypothetical protein